MYITFISFDVSSLSRILSFTIGTKLSSKLEMKRSTEEGKIIVSLIKNHILPFLRQKLNYRTAVVQR